MEKPRITITPELIQNLSELTNSAVCTKDAWDYCHGTETNWQIIKREFRGALWLVGIDWTRIPGIRGSWKFVK